MHISDEVDMKRSMEKVWERYCSVTANLRVRKKIKSDTWKKNETEGK